MIAVKKGWSKMIAVKFGWGQPVKNLKRLPSNLLGVKKDCRQICWGPKKIAVKIGRDILNCFKKFGPKALSFGPRA